MVRLPQPGGDAGNWGEILNEYLSQSHKTDGTLKNDSVTAATISDGTIEEAQLSSAVQAKLNASAGTPSWNDITGKPAVIAAGASQADARTAIGAGTSNVAIAGDLSGTPASPAVANGAITSAKIADGTIVSGDIAASAGITKTQLSTAVQASLDKADSALQSAPASGSGSLSGFPLKKTGERAVAVGQEVAVARAHDSDPAGRKIVVLAESWDQPGVLKHIWVACDNSTTTNGFLEQGATIRIYTDSSSAPAVSMSLGDFFCLANRSDIFATPRVGRTDRGDGGSAYRYLYMPFQKYLRVEIESNMASDTAFYGTADYSVIASFADLGTQQLSYAIKGQRVANHPRQTPLTIYDGSGSGQVESIVVSFSGADGGDSGVLEGNVQIFVDNEAYPMWTSSGMEDAFNGGWYSMPVGGYPAGRAGNSDQPGANQTMYRFFLDDPIFYTSHIKVVVSAGQPYQGSVVSSTVNFAGYVGLWSNTPVTPNYQALDTGAAPVLNDQLDQAAGALNGANWVQDGSRTPMVATGSTFTVPYGSAAADQDVRATRQNVSLPADYWVETRFRATDATHDDQEVALYALGASPDSYFGSAVHIELRRYHVSSWAILLRDDFGTPFITYIGGGMDLTNMWVRVALKKSGNFVTGYYSFSETSPTWIPVGRWEATKTGAGFGIGTWTAGAEFDYLVVRPLRTVTS